VRDAKRLSDSIQPTTDNATTAAQMYEDLIFILIISHSSGCLFTSRPIGGHG